MCVSQCQGLQWRVALKQTPPEARGLAGVGGKECCSLPSCHLLALVATAAAVGPALERHPPGRMRQAIEMQGIACVFSESRKGGWLLHDDAGLVIWQ